jgi:hypothetical protein
MRSHGLGLVLVAVAAFGAVHTDYDHKADFGRYRTYSWLGVRAGNPAAQEKIAAAIDAQLAAKGWTRVAHGGDASVSAVMRASDKDTLEGFYKAYPEWGWKGWGAAGTAGEPMGVLTVDIFDGSSKKLVWRSVATEDRAIGEMFAQFPPKSKD